MANEFVHATVGTSLTQLEFEAVGLHVLNSQATGDLIYASSSSQLSRLGIGATNKILTVIGGVPTWQSTLAGLTLTSPIINGTVTTTGLTLPAATMGGLLKLHSAGMDTQGAQIYSTTPHLFRSLVTGGSIGYYFQSYNAASASTTRLTITSGVATAVATWSAVTQVGLVLGGNMTVTGYGFVGPVISTNSYMEVTEMAAPGAGAANTARIYAVVGGDTLTDLAAVFQDGTVDIFAQEATPLDSPIFTEADDTEIKMVQLKPHPGIIQFAVKYPDGRTHVLKEIQYHNEDKINANTGARAPLPLDWEVETKAEMDDRLAKLEQGRLDAIEATEVLSLVEERK